MPDILGCHRSALCHVGCRVDGASLHAASGDGDGENDGKEYFHGTKVSLLTARVRLSDCRSDCAADRRFKFHKRVQLFIRTHNGAVISAAMRVGNEDCSPVGVHG